MTEIIYSFFICGIACFIADIIYSNTNITAGHITTMFSVFGVVLGFFGIYNKLIKTCEMGAITLISNFGNSLYLSALEGYYKYGFLGIFSEMFNNSSLVISSTIIFSFIFIIIFKPRD